MGWLLRFSANSGPTAELATSQLWDLGTTGLFEGPDWGLTAGFETEGEAQVAATHFRTADGILTETVTVGPVGAPSDWAVNTTPDVVQVNSGGHTFSIAITAEATFGHGAHPTTRLALDLLVAAIDTGVDVLDLGTGSGVLAIAAAKAGAGSVTAIDIDPDAVPVTTRNAEANGVQIEASTNSVTEAMAGRAAGFDVIVANVLLPVHRLLAADIVGALAPNGTLITAGYLSDQVAELSGCYIAARSDLLITEETTSDDWAAHRFSAAASI